MTHIFCSVQGYTPPDAPASEYQTIPLNKIEDFGVHCKQYYPLDVSYYKSSVDAHMLEVLWNKYWVNTLSASPLLATRDLVAGQITDIGTCVQYPSLFYAQCPCLACVHRRCFSCVHCASLWCEHRLCIAPALTVCSFPSPRVSCIFM
jgi:hypothetical protein